MRRKPMVIAKFLLRRPSTSNEEIARRLGPGVCFDPQRGEFFNWHTGTIVGRRSKRDPEFILIINPRANQAVFGFANEIRKWRFR